MFTSKKGDDFGGVFTFIVFVIMAAAFFIYGMPFLQSTFTDAAVAAEVSLANYEATKSLNSFIGETQSNVKISDLVEKSYRENDFEEFGKRAQVFFKKRHTTWILQIHEGEKLLYSSEAGADFDAASTKELTSAELEYPFFVESKLVTLKLSLQIRE